MNAPQLSHINPQDSKYLITQTGRSPSATWAAGAKNIRNQNSKVPDDVPIFFRNMATLVCFVILRQFRKLKNLSLMYMDLPIWGAEARNSCLFPHSKRSQWKFFTVLFFFLWSETSRKNGFDMMTWLFSGRSLWTKAVGSMQLRNTFWLWAFSIVSTWWPVTPPQKFTLNQESMTFGLWGSLLEGCKHVRFYVSIIL